jgi:hypothetical protein
MSQEFRLGTGSLNGIRIQSVVARSERTRIVPAEQMQASELLEAADRKPWVKSVPGP